MLRLVRQFGSRSQFDPIKITERAWKKLDKVTERTNKPFLFYADSGGCNGFNYRLKNVDVENNGKIAVVKKGSTKVYVDPLSEMYVIGTVIDFEEEDIENGVFESKFTFTPDKKIASTCGCGVSFAPKIVDE